MNLSLIRSLSAAAVAISLVACSANSGPFDDDGGGIPPVDGLRCVDPLLSVNGATASGSSSINCIGCEVRNPEASIDGELATAATFAVGLSLLGGTVTLDVDSGAGAPQPAPSMPGFIIRTPQISLLELNLLGALTLSTLAGGEVQEQNVQFSVLDLDLLGLVDLGLAGSADGLSAIVIDATQPFDALRLRLFSLLGLAIGIDVVGACRDFEVINAP